MTRSAAPTNLIWATRGRSWGFRFLLDAGFADPLPEYERAFAGSSDASTTYCSTGVTKALRFPDPSGRRDSAGRIIPHEFIVFGEPGRQIRSVEDGIRRVWPLVEDAFSRTWMFPRAPQLADLGFVT